MNWGKKITNEVEDISNMIDYTRNEIYARIWNAALEGAAKIAEKYESNGAAYEIRLAKKKESVGT
jgi:hypothetical protein